LTTCAVSDYPQLSLCVHSLVGASHSPHRVPEGAHQRRSDRGLRHIQDSSCRCAVNPVDQQRNEALRQCVRTLPNPPIPSAPGTSLTRLTSFWAGWPATLPRCCAASTSPRSPRTSTAATSSSSSTPTRWR